MLSKAYIANVKRQFKYIDQMSAEERALVYEFGLKKAMQLIQNTQ